MGLPGNVELMSNYVSGKFSLGEKQFPRKIIQALSLTKKTFPHHHAIGKKLFVWECILKETDHFLFPKVKP